MYEGGESAGRGRQMGGGGGRCIVSSKLYVLVPPEIIYIKGGGSNSALVSYPHPDSRSCGWITSPLRGKSTY